MIYKTQKLTSKWTETCFYINPSAAALIFVGKYRPYNEIGQGVKSFTLFTYEYGQHGQLTVVKKSSKSYQKVEAVH